MDNSSYTVTSPDLLLSSNGITILIVSQNEDTVDEIKRMFEKYIVNQIVFCVQNKVTTEANMGWSYYISRSCDMVIVDLDNCEWIDVCMALTKELKEDFEKVIFYSEKSKKRTAEMLQNSLGNYVMIRSLAELDSYIIDDLMNRSD